MKQEDLKNLKIEDLEDVTDGHYVFGQKVILVSDLVRFSKTVFAIVKDNDHGIITDSDYYSSKIFKAYKIPKPQTREMNSLEVMEYLHLLQLKLNRVDVKLLHFDFVNDEFFKNRNLLQNGGFDSGVVVYSVGSNDNYGDWANYSSFWVFIDDMSYKFGILKNGKVTEFKIPQIEA